MIKSEIRKKYSKIRQNIDVKRRKIAESQALETLLPLLCSHVNVLSYFSFADEFSTCEINHYLTKRNNLNLPRMTPEGLKIFRIKNLEKDLEINSYGIFEPIPQKCQELNPKDLSCVLVPGIAFDQFNQRLGYGKGYYDRLLSKLTHLDSIYGLGFKEQIALEPLPVEINDIPLRGGILTF